ncbi:SDR family oxidoreductase [Corynebacterium sp. 35RC1]|nr:SDR family oxidoreductase [Corynebacterium sp. 35RC1]
MITWPTENLTTIITGGASGIGFATARKWVEGGGQPVLLDVSLASLEAAEAELGTRALYRQVDVTDTNSIKAAFEDLEFIDCLINCAGNSRPHPTETISDDDWNSVIDIHLSGTLKTCREAFERLCVNGGSIVNISSIAGSLGMPHRASYNAAKHGIEGLTKSLAVEWANKAIRVNCVAPGYISTPFTEQLIDDGKLNPDPIIERTPLGRWATPEEIADSICFLALPVSSYITGQALRIDGGMAIDGSWY